MAGWDGDDGEVCQEAGEGGYHTQTDLTDFRKSRKQRIAVDMEVFFCYTVTEKLYEDCIKRYDELEKVFFQ